MAKRKESGFTIIEVALVLAIAALIFLVVFLAVPALQRNQRDDARKRDVSSVVEAVTNRAANNAGTALTTGVAYGGTTASNLASYLSDPLSGNTTSVKVDVTGAAATFTDTTVPEGTIVVFDKTQCKDNTGVEAASGRRAAVATKIEGGGGSWYCQDAS